MPAAMTVIAAKTAEWGLLPVSAEESLAPDAGYHRRYMVHGTSHHLGLDVHDCGQARREFYADGLVEAGMVFTIEPDGWTVVTKDHSLSAQWEHTVLVTDTGYEVLTLGARSREPGLLEGAA